MAKQQRGRAERSNAVRRHKPSEFERDKARMLFLCREILVRMAHEPDPRSIGPIWPLIAEMRDSGIAEKLGFLGEPLIFEERDHPPSSRWQEIHWNEPFGTVSGSVQLACSYSIKKKNGAVEVIRTQYEQAENRRTLAGALDAWIRAVEGLQEPDVYPTLPKMLDPDADHRLWSDPFWRQLKGLARIVVAERTAQLEPHFGAICDGYERRLNVLAQDAKLVSRRVFVTMNNGDLFMFQPLGGKTGPLEPNPLKSLLPLESGSLVTLRQVLDAWMEARAGVLLESERAASRRDGTTPEWLVRALLEVQASPGDSDAQIAKRVGVHRAQLSRNETYRSAAAMARGNPERPYRGRRVRLDEGGSGIEAEAEPDAGD